MRRMKEKKDGAAASAVDVAMDTKAASAKAGASKGSAVKKDERIMTTVNGVDNNTHDRSATGTAKKTNTALSQTATSISKTTSLNSLACAKGLPPKATVTPDRTRIKSRYERSMRGSTKRRERDAASSSGTMSTAGSSAVDTATSDIGATTIGGNAGSMADTGTSRSNAHANVIISGATATRTTVQATTKTAIPEHLLPNNHNASSNNRQDALSPQEIRDAANFTSIQFSCGRNGEVEMSDDGLSDYYSSNDNQEGRNDNNGDEYHSENGAVFMNAVWTSRPQDTSLSTTEIFESKEAGGIVGLLTPEKMGGAGKCMRELTDVLMVILLFLIA